MKLGISPSAIVAAACLLGGGTVGTAESSSSAASTRTLAEEEKEAAVGGFSNSTCENAGSAWAGCAGHGSDPAGGAPAVTNATEWWYEKIHPHIPEAELEYYREPFGGAAQPSLYRPDLVRRILREDNAFQGITYSHLLGGRDVGARTPIHRHDFSATTHVLSGYATVFLEGSPPTTYGPGESYYMPPGGLTMTSAIMPNPVYGGEPVRQTEFSTSLDANAFPTGASVTTFVEVEMLPDGGTFDWRSGRWERCAEYPRYACSIPSIEKNPQDSTASVQEEANSAPNKEISQESEHAGPEKSSTSRDIPATEEGGENSQKSSGSIRARSLLSSGAFFLPILLLPMVS